MHIYICLIICFRFIKSASKVFKSAEESNIQGDEETAYVYYMKYFNLISAIKKIPEYKKNEVTNSSVSIYYSRELM